MPRPIPPKQARAYRAEGWWLAETLTDLLRRQAATRPQAPAIIAPDRALTFRELDHESDRVAAGLARLGVGRGEVVSCQLSNIAEFLILHHAVAKRRAIFNPIHLPYRAAEVAHILAFAESRVVAVGPPYRGFSFVEMVRGLRAQLPCLRHVVAVGGERADGVLPFETLRGGDREGTSHDPSRPDDPFLLLFTSGTTASPKAVLHTHSLRMGSARFGAEGIGFTGADRVLSIARLSHMWGLYSYWMALWAGAAQVLLPTSSAQAFVEVATRERATVAIGAPPHVADLLVIPDRELPPQPCLRLFALSGSVCPPALAGALRDRLGCAPLMLWGMTETGGALYTRPGDPPALVDHTVGRAAPGCTVALLDDEGRPLGSNVEGELAIKGPYVFDGYVNNPDATAESFTRDGWFLTGDMASIDEAGYVRILGRRKEQINRGGAKFHPADVEEALLRHPRVQTAALVGVPDPRLGERSYCVVVPRPGQAPPTLADLTRVLAEAGIAKFKWPEHLTVMTALPLTPTGKVQRAVLRERLRQQAEPDLGDGPGTRRNAHDHSA